MAYTRGSTSDFDRFARVTNDPGWSWDKLQPYIKRVIRVLFFDSVDINWTRPVRTKSLKPRSIITISRVNLILRCTVPLEEYL